MRLLNGRRRLGPSPLESHRRLRGSWRTTEPADTSLSGRRSAQEPLKGLVDGVITPAHRWTGIVPWSAFIRPRRLGQKRVAGLVDQHDGGCLAILLPRLT